MTSKLIARVSGRLLNLQICNNVVGGFLGSEASWLSMVSFEGKDIAGFISYQLIEYFVPLKEKGKARSRDKNPKKNQRVGRSERQEKERRSVLYRCTAACRLS
jgi:hypothetical protein